MTFDPKLTETQILALTLYGECRSAALDEIIAHACVLRNQAKGSTLAAVCGAAPCWAETGGNHDKLVALMQALLAGTVRDPKFAEAVWVATGIVGGYCRDVVKGAVAAHPVAQVPRPDWAQTRVPCLTYARHIFYAPVEAS